MKWRWSKLLTTFMALLVLTACQIQGNKGSADDADSGLFELKGQQLTDVKRICDALQLKRHFLFEVADREKRAQLNVRKRDCGDTQEYDLGNFDADVRIVGAQAPYLEATTARSRYLQEIVLDNNGDIAHFCESTYTNEPKTKIELADKTMELQVVFEGRYDKYIIKKTWTNSPIPGFYEIEEGIVHTSRTDQNEDLRGILKQRIFRKPCSVGPEEYFIQTFLQLL